jgi:hypothetical protein
LKHKQQQTERRILQTIIEKNLAKKHLRTRRPRHD